MDFVCMMYIADILYAEVQSEDREQTQKINSLNFWLTTVL